MKNLILGVDIGTSSLKLVILNKLSSKIAYEASHSTSSARLTSENRKFDEQDIKKILEIVDTAFQSIPNEFLEKIQAVQICGQMHGVVLWNKYSHKHSNLITWQDERCDEEFLNSLPVKSRSDISSGFGCASLFWLRKNGLLQPEFDMAGTVQDYLTFLFSGQLVMSDQNALSWGFYDLESNRWQDDLLNCDFPSYLLPKVSRPGYKVSSCVTLLNSVKLDAEIFNALGDLQSSVLSCLEYQTDCSQICLPIDTKLLGTFELPKSVTSFPFFDNKALLVSASLNGGNVLEKFVDMLIEWDQELEMEVSREKIWQKLIEKAEKCACTVNVDPVLYAERHNRVTYGSMSNLRHDNLKVGCLFRGVCEGLVKNLHTMMGKDLILKLKCERVIATGGALIRNPLLRSCLQSQFEYLPIVYKRSADAAHGAAVYLKKLIK